MLHRDGTWRAMHGLVRVCPDADGKPAQLSGSLFEKAEASRAPTAFGATSRACSYFAGLSQTYVASTSAR
jgi:hypothetical protein